MATREQNAQALIDACTKSLRSNEYNVRKIKGVRCTASDCSTAILYAQTILKRGDYTPILRAPVCEVAELLSKFHLLSVTDTFCYPSC